MPTEFETYTNAPLREEVEPDPAQAQNDAVEAIGAAVDAVLTKALSSNAASVTVNELKGAGVLRITGTLTANGTVTIAAALTKKFYVENATSGAFTLTIKVSGQTGVTLDTSTQGASVMLRVDGTDVVPVGNGTPAGADVSADNTWTGVQRFSAGQRWDAYTPSQITSDQNNYDAGTAPVSRISSDASRAITGLANPVDGRDLWLVNVGANNITLRHDSSSSTAGNRMYLPNNSDMVLTPNTAVLMWYDATSSRWRSASRVIGYGTDAGTYATGNRGLPTGGSVRQILRKLSGTNYDFGFDYDSGDRVSRFLEYRPTTNGFTSTSGTGTSYNPDDSFMGKGPVWTANMGSTSTGGAFRTRTDAGAISNTLGAFVLNHYTSVQTSVQVCIPTLSGGSDTFTVYAGLTRSLTNASTAPTTGAFFRISGSTLQFVCSNSGTETATTWGTSIVANTWYSLMLVYTSSGVDFYVNGTLEATISTNLPSAANGYRDFTQPLKATGTTVLAVKFCGQDFKLTI